MKYMHNSANSQPVSPPLILIPHDKWERLLSESVSLRQKHATHRAKTPTIPENTTPAARSDEARNKTRVNNQTRVAFLPFPTSLEIWLKSAPPITASNVGAQNFIS